MSNDKTTPPPAPPAYEQRNYTPATPQNNYKPATGSADQQPPPPPPSND